MSFARSTAIRAAVTLAIVGSFSAAAQAGTVVPCGADVCAVDFSIFVGSEFSAPNTDGAEFGGGQLLYDANSGEISLDLDTVRGNGVRNGDMLMWNMPDGTQVRVQSLSGNADPILGFGLGATTAGTGRSFAFAFSLPIALSGPIDAQSSINYSLSSFSSAGAQVTAITGNVLSAFELDTSVAGLGALNKGVDAGSTFGFLGGPTTQAGPVYTATNSFTGDLAYDLMTVNVTFGLSADSAVGISGFVEQVPVPVPAGVWLLLSGIGALAALRRR